MCGLNFTTVDNVIDKMNEKIVHRGLMGKQFSHSDLKKQYHFGHIRLPIQGLSSAFDQPYITRRYVFLFVGEIFNYKELDNNAKSDICVLSNYWKKYGESCFEKFDGFWSVIIYDKFEKLVHIFTDYLAKKPLYIHLPTLSVSSEIKSLCLLEDEIEIDPLYFSKIEKWGYCIGDETFCTNIKKIPPCSHWMIKNNTLYKDSYISIVPRKVDLYDAIKKAVKNRLVSDIPFSLLLSGGLDSSIIYKLMIDETKNFTIFHIDNNEENFLNYLNIPGCIKVIKLKLDSYDIINTLYCNEGPVDLGSVFSQYTLAKAISKYDINIAISGDGADELFGGYTRITDYDSQYSDVFEELVYYHLPRLDKLMMAETIELRCPYLSRSVIEGSLFLSYQSRIRKRYLKILFRNLVPKEIINRKKLALKSVKVLEDRLGWRYYLVQKFKERIIDEYK